MNKFLLVLSLFVFSCTHKYSTYHTIHTEKFEWDRQYNGSTKKLRRDRKVNFSSCANQWLFFNNALTDSKKAFRDRLRFACGANKLITNAQIDKDWWTLLFFSRSCISLEGYCAKNYSSKK